MATDTLTKTERKMLTVITPETHEKELRVISEPVDLLKLAEPQMQEFIDDLTFTVRNYKMPKGWMAAGLSAIQVNVPQRIFLALDYNSDKFIEFINPEIEFQGEAQDVKLEACLSLPNQEGNVKRFKRIRVTYFDRYGDKHRERFTGWTARVIQHEYDHLQGILFTDKLF